MAKVKPYLITVKYISVYSDPPPTLEQIANELNVDALELHIEEAVVYPKGQKPEAAPVVLDAVDVPAKPLLATILTATGKPTKVDKIRRNMMPFDTTDLDSNGPSVKILAALFNKPRTQAELRQITKLGTSTVATTLYRLKSKGRVIPKGSHPAEGTIYEFVK